METDAAREADLVSAARNGDRQAFGKLVSRHLDVVARTIAGIIGRVEEVDDVAQDVFMKFYETLPSYRGDASVATYLSRIAVNRSLDVLRKRKRRQLRIVSLEPGRAGSESPSVDGELVLEREENKRAVRAAIEKLSPDHRAVIVLRMLEGYSTEEAAEILNVPYGTVLSRLKRATDKLRRHLQSIAGPGIETEA